jgi:exopolysaccharide biosynthesis polyprenyl glycosylphosphotransferase
MIAYRARGLVFAHSFLLMMAAALIFWGWLSIFFGLIRGVGLVDHWRYGIYSGLVVMALGVAYVLAKLNARDVLKLSWPEVAQISFQQILLIVGVLLLFLAAVQDIRISRLFFFSLIPLLYAALLLLNRRVPEILASWLFRSRRTQKTVLLGKAQDASKLRDWIRSKKHYGIDVVGLLTDSKLGEECLDCPILGTSKDLETVVRCSGATQLIVLDLPNSIAKAGRIAQICETMGVRLLMVNDVEEKFHRPVHFFEDAGVRFVGFREEPLECPVNRAVKRVLDLAIALPVAIFVLPPVCVIVYALQKWQSPGPVFFRQSRTGINFEPFEILKFRTMHADEGNQMVQAREGDPRVFRAGHWLRRLSVDELPQVLNVIRGEMSIVGPRPHMVEHDGQFEAIAKTYRLRSLVKPGITGLAQIQGRRGEVRENADMVERVRSDVFYMENWSLGLDWVIILRTAVQMLNPPKTAY